MSKYSDLADRLVAHPEHWEFKNLRREAAGAIRELEKQVDDLNELAAHYRERYQSLVSKLVAKVDEVGRG